MRDGNALPLNPGGAMYKVLVCDPIDKKSFQALLDLGYEAVEQSGLNEAQLVEVIPAYHAMIVRSATKVTAKVIEAASNMKIILRGGVGVDNIDVKAAEAKGIKVMNTPAASSLAVAELTIALMFALARKIAKADASMQSGTWDKKSFSGTELNGKTLGLIGSGRIGSHVARIAGLLGMDVIACDPFITNFPFGTLVKTSEEVFRNSDYISLHVPLTPQTKNMVNEHTIAMMKPTAFLINCARGGVVDEKAFAEAVKAGKVAGGAFDVFEPEPPKEQFLAGLAGVILTPHIGASTKEAQARIGGELVRILKEELPC
jgi:D-3-phosphoglycerate dehydrogenase